MTPESTRGLSRYLKNTSWRLFEGILRLVVSLFVTVAVIRYLGPHDYGLYSYAISVVSLFVPLAALGLDNFAVKRLVAHPEQTDNIIGTTFILKLGGGIIACAAVLLFCLLAGESEVNRSLIIIVSLSLIFQSMGVVDFYLQANLLSKYMAYVQIVQMLISAVIKLYGVYAHKEINYFVIVYVFDFLIVATGYFLIYIHLRKRWSLLFKLSDARRLLAESWPMIFSAVTIAIYMRIDQVMLEKMLGVEAVGVYSAAMRLSELWYFIPVAIAASVFPAIVNAKANGTEIYTLRVQKLYDYLVIVAAVIAIVISFMSEFVVALLFGDAYQAASGVLVVHIWTSVFVFIGVASTRYLVMENLQRFTFYRSFAGALINIALNYLLIPVYGPLGAAVASLVAQMWAAYFADIISKQTQTNFYMKTKAILFVNFINGDLKLGRLF